MLWWQWFYWVNNEDTPGIFSLKPKRCEWKCGKYLLYIIHKNLSTSYSCRWTSSTISGMIFWCRSRPQSWSRSVSSSLQPQYFHNQMLDEWSRLETNSLLACIDPLSFYHHLVTSPEVFLMLSCFDHYSQLIKIWNSLRCCYILHSRNILFPIMFLKE